MPRSGDSVSGRYVKASVGFCWANKKPQRGLSPHPLPMPPISVYSHDQRDELATPLVGSFPLAAMEKNPLLKPAQRLGSVRATVYDLPSANGNIQHEYGLRQERDGLTSADVCGGWATYKGTGDQQPPRDFKALNKNAAIQGCKDAKQMGEFRKHHDFRITVSSGTVAVNVPYDRNTVFGRPSEPPERMTDIVSHQARYEWAANKPKATELQEKLKTKKPSETKTSRLLAETARAKLADKTTGPMWKMSSFANVPAKIGQRG
jgi:hypothetical protein